jgi:serine/threonine protein kinase/Tol biopolymer transport system component
MELTAFISESELRTWASRRCPRPRKVRGKRTSQIDFGFLEHLFKFPVTRLYGSWRNSFAASVWVRLLAKSGAAIIVSILMAVTVGTQLGAYEITALLGKGGMGEVYRARDLRLKREVAVKILPEEFSRDADRVSRFQREAEVLASLSHPNIGGIHSLEEANGSRYLVLELVEGETLADRVAHGPIPAEEALDIARSIGEALEAAHEKGIIHRDLKPANVKITPEGRVKVLDFGLAKVFENTPASAALSNTPTLSVAATQQGIILGTAAYMSPEQAKGKPADKRSDLWAFGCVLYEMLTGKGAFRGEDVSETLASVLKSEPDWTLLPHDVPQALRTLIHRCLAKDRRQRISEIATATFILSELNNLGASPPSMAVSAAPPSRWQRARPAAATAALAAIIIGTGMWALRPGPSPRVVAQFSFSLPKGQAFTGATRQLVATSPDGTRLAYVADSRIYLRSIGDLEPRAIPGTETAGGLISPTFAPDGESIAYVEVRSYTLKRIPISGGAASTMAGQVGLPCGASWGPEGVLIGSTVPGQRGILRVSSGGGVPELIIGAGADEQACGPQMLPGGNTVLFTLAKVTEENPWDQAQIVAQSLADGSRRVLIKGGSDARYLPTGHLLYAVAGTMYAVPFDTRRLTVTGTAVPAIVGVRRSSPGQTTSDTHLAVSVTGTLVYVPGPATTSAALFVLVLGDGRGDPVPLKVPPAAYVHPRVSPDGRVLAVGRNDGQNTDIWMYDLSGKTELRRLTFGGNNRFPVWSSDSRRITFQSGREGDQAIWWQTVDGGSAERLTKPADGEEHVPESWSPDGRHLLFYVAKSSGQRPARQGSYSLWVLTLEGRKTEPFGSGTSYEYGGAAFSPDGRWVAYSLSVGRADSPNRGVFVEPFPVTGEKHQAPRTEGRDYHPVWAPDGKSLFYVPEGPTSTVSVPFTTQPAVAFGKPIEMTRMPRPGLQAWQPRGYDVLPDGRFISVSIDPGAAEVHVVLNWFRELQERVPVK